MLAEKFLIIFLLIMASVGCGSDDEAGSDASIGEDASGMDAQISVDARLQQDGTVAMDAQLLNDASSQMDSSAADAAIKPGSRDRVFITSQTYQGDFLSNTNGQDALTFANSICQSTANASDLGGRWRMLISFGNQDAAANLVGNGPWRNINGDIIFANRASVFGSVPMSMELIDEKNAGYDPTIRFWTGTLADGTVGTSTCSGWTTINETGHMGNIGGGVNWPRTATQLCSTQARLLCFEETL